MPETPGVPGRPLIELELEPSAFAADWKHCDQVANYLARIGSFDRSDSFLYSNLLSTVLNELLEVVFFEHQAGGKLQCSLLRNGTEDRIALRIPVDASHRAFYERSVRDSQAPNVAELYTRSLLGQQTLDRSVGFLELAADYGAKISLNGAEGEGTLNLQIDVRFEEAASSPAPATAS